MVRIYSGDNLTVELCKIFARDESEKANIAAINAIRQAFRASKKAPGAQRIYTAGEKEYDISVYRKDKSVPFNDPVKEAFRAVNEKLNLPF